MGTLRLFATIFAFFAVCVARRLDLTAKGAKNSQRDAKIIEVGLLSVVLLIATFAAPQTARASSTFEEYEGRLIGSIEITFEGSPPDPSAEAEFLSIISILPNSEFSAVSIRRSLQDLFNSERVANARVEVVGDGSTRGPLRLRYV